LNCFVGALWLKAGWTQWLTFRDELAATDREMWIGEGTPAYGIGRWIAVAVFVVIWPLVFALMSWRDRGAGA
jgi:hypothetical protein